MFYDIDILKRRGKFGIIWLAANNKLRLEGKGSKNDLRLLLELRVGLVCDEIVRYVRTLNPGTKGSSPRFSLYLSAMLAHGAIVVHHKQVSHTLAYARLTFQQRVATKKLKESNTSCDVLDLSDNVIGAGKYFMTGGQSLEDSEFGCLFAVVDDLNIQSICRSPNNHQALLYRLQLNQPSSPGQLAKSFEEIEEPSGFHDSQMCIYASPSDITMVEVEPPLPIAELLPIEKMFFGNDTFEDTSGPIELLSLVDEDQAMQVPGPSNLRRNNSKRVNQEESNATQVVPRKQSRTEPPGEESFTTSTAMQYPVIQMQRLKLPVQPRGGGRRRRRRLLIDEETSLLHCSELNLMIMDICCRFRMK